MNNKSQTKINDEIDLMDLFMRAWSQKYLVIFFLMVGIFLSAITYYQTPEVYSSEIIVKEKFKSATQHQDDEKFKF